MISVMTTTATISYDDTIAQALATWEGQRLVVDVARGDASGEVEVGFIGRLVRARPLDDDEPEQATVLDFDLGDGGGGSVVLERASFEGAEWLTWPEPIWHGEPSTRPVAPRRTLRIRADGLRVDLTA